MPFVIPEEVKQVQRLFIEGKKKEAFMMLDGFKYNDFSLQFYRGLFYYFQGDFKMALEIADQIFEENQKLKDYFFLFDAISLKFGALYFLSRFDQLGELVALGEKFLTLAPKKPKHEIEIREIELLQIKAIYQVFFEDNFDFAINIFEKTNSFLEQNDRSLGLLYLSNLMWAAHSYSFKGELNKALELYEKSLASEFHKKNPGAVSLLFIASGLSDTGEIFIQKGNLDQAITNFEKSLILSEKANERFFIGWTFNSLIKALLAKKSLTLAENYLERFQKYIIQDGKTQISNLYQLSKASILSQRPRLHDKVEAINILKDLNKKKTGFLVNTHVSITLCDLLLAELQMTNEITVLDEIKPLITRLLEIAEDRRFLRSYQLLIQVNLLQAKISLLTFDIKLSQRFLTQAQQIAERYGLNQLKAKIADTHEDLLKKLDLWEKLKETGASMADRMELARLDERTLGMIQNSLLLTAQITEDKVAIHKEKKICLVCRGEVLKFSYICGCGAMYCESCARALANLENVCWACDVPIDDLKPVKPYKEEERVHIEEKVKKK